MAIKKIIKMGNKQLATPSLPLENFEQLGSSYPGLRELINDMIDTMLDEGGAGIAAPQIGCNLRVIMFGIDKNVRYPDEAPIPLTILINPVIKVLSDEMVDGWELVHNCFCKFKPT